MLKVGREEAGSKKKADEWRRRKGAKEKIETTMLQVVKKEERDIGERKWKIHKGGEKMQGENVAEEMGRQRPKHMGKKTAASLPG